MAQDPVNKGHVVLLFSTPVSPYANLESSVYLTVLYTCLPLIKYDLKTVHGHHIRRHTELDGTSDVFRWRNVANFSKFLRDHCAISDISNINQQTKEHQTSQERRHELVIM